MSGIRLTHVIATVWVLVLVSVPAFAQIDLSGSWTSRMYEDWIERGPGSDLADYTGLPLSDDARAKALTYEPTVYAMRERQCLFLSPYTTAYFPHGVRMWNETDSQGRIAAWKLSGVQERDILTIWMDGRPHPSANAFHPFSGFTTGTWEGDTLTAYTTHLKAGTLRRGNGIPMSDQATITAHFTRHDDLLTMTTIQEDPVYLTEPHVVSRTWQLDPRGNVIRQQMCFAVTEIPRLEDSGIVPHLLPGENPEADFMTRTYNIPREAALGYAETLYPEYRKTIRDTYKAPTQCARYCCGWVGFQGLPDSAPTLSCIIGGTGKLSIPPPPGERGGR